METIKTFIEGIKAKDIADIFISIAILVIFFVLSIWLPRLLLKIWKVNEKDKKVLKENDTYKGLRSIFLCFGIYLALIILALPATAMAFCIKLIRVAVILSIAKILVGMISPTSKLMKKVKGNEKLQENQKLIQTGTKLLKVLIYIVAGFMIISEFGYDLNGIITGLGLGSVVIALAAQELVSNLLSGMAMPQKNHLK